MYIIIHSPQYDINDPAPREPMFLVERLRIAGSSATQPPGTKTQTTKSKGTQPSTMKVTSSGNNKRARIEVL